MKNFTAIFTNEKPESRKSLNDFAKANDIKIYQVISDIKILEKEIRKGDLTHLLIEDYNLGKSLKDFTQIVSLLDEFSINIITTTGTLPTTTTDLILWANFFKELEKYHRKTRAVRAWRNPSNKMGPKSKCTPELLAQIKEQLDGKVGMTEIAENLNIHLSTLYKYKKGIK